VIVQEIEGAVVRRTQDLPSAVVRAPDRGLRELAEGDAPHLVVRHPLVEQHADRPAQHEQAGIDQVRVGRLDGRQLLLGAGEDAPDHEVEHRHHYLRSIVIVGTYLEHAW
jgi:hypothetical protein